MSKQVKFNKGVAKNRQEIKKNARSMSQKSWRGVEEGTVYWDPIGGRLGKPVNAKDELFSADESAIEKFNEMQRKGWSLRESVTEVRKNLDTGDWQLPIFHVPDIRVVNPELTPAADLIARETVAQDEVSVTPQTGQPSVEWGLENTSDTESSYTYGEGTYGDYDYPVVGYGLATRLEDKLILAAQELRSSRQVAEKTHMTSMRQAEERQILLGTSNNSSGFQGFEDLGTEKTTVDSTYDVKQEIRDLIDEVEFQGGNRNSMAVFVNFETHQDLRNALDDFVRYEIGDNSIGFGFDAMEFDGVPILKSHALPKLSNASSTDTVALAVDMGTNYMGMLQDITVKPLAKTGPQEQLATDAYGTLVSEAHDHIQYLAKV